MDGSDHAVVSSPGFYGTEAEQWQDEPPDPREIALHSPQCYAPMGVWVRFDPTLRACAKRGALKRLDKKKWGTGIDVVFIGRKVKFTDDFQGFVDYPDGFNAARGQEEIAFDQIPYYQ